MSQPREENPQDEAARILGNVVRTEAEELVRKACTMADLGLGICFLKGIAGAGNTAKSRAIILVLSGDLPDDLSEDVNRYIRGLVQDLTNGGKTRTVLLRTSDHETDKPQG